MFDDKTPQEAIADAEAAGHTPDKEQYIIVKQKDGNWKGYGNKNGKPIEVRDIGPETVLQRLLTHA